MNTWEIINAVLNYFLQIEPNVTLTAVLNYFLQIEPNVTLTAAPVYMKDSFQYNLNLSEFNFMYRILKTISFLSNILKLKD